MMKCFESVRNCRCCSGTRYKRAPAGVWNIAGQEVFSALVSNGNNLVRMNVGEGLYLYRISLEDGQTWTGKVSVVID